MCTDGSGLSKDDWLAAYDQVQKFYRLNNENYFKRTQLIMVVIQSALFLGLTKVLNDNGVVGKMWLISVISVLGILASYAWTEMIKRQRQRLELCRYYMRYIESQLPGDFLRFCTYEAFVFHHNNYSQLGDVKFPLKKIRKAVYRVELGIAWFLCGFWGITAGITAIVYLVNALNCAH